MKVGFLIKQFDLISQKPSLLINNSERVKSFYGAFLTILLVGFTLAFGVYFLVLLFGRINPQLLLYEERIIPGTKIYFDDKFPIFFKVNTDADENLNDYFSFRLFMNSGSVKTPINLQPCDGYDMLTGGDFLCLFSNTTTSSPPFISSRDIKLHSDTNNNDEKNLNYTSISVGLSFCTKNDTCKLPTQRVFSLIDEGKVFLEYGHIKTSFDIKNTSYPSSYVNSPVIFVQKLSHSTKYNLDIGIIAEKYITDFGYILQDLFEISFYSISPYTKVTSEFKVGNYDFNNFKNDSSKYKVEDAELINISIGLMSDWLQIHSRSFYTGQRFFAEIGGVFNFLFVITYHLNLIYSSVYFNLKVDNTCKLSYFVEREFEMRKLMSNRLSMKNHKVSMKEEIHTGMQLK
jgi:hypothetical protein